MKKLLIKKIIITISILLGVVGLAVGGYIGYNALFAKQAEIEDTEAKYSTTLKEKPTDGSDPTEYSVEDNVAYALWTIENTEEFWTLTTGVANAAGQEQGVYNKRVVKGENAMITMIPYGIVKKSKQRYFMPDKVLLRDGKATANDQATWETGTPECVSYNVIKKRYGWLPWQGTGYIICTETYINQSEQKMIDNGNGTYTLVFDLNPDPEMAPFWYRREVLTNAGSSIIPEFHSIHIEYTIDNEWHILSSDIAEQYKVKAAGVEAVTKTNCHEEFHYDNVEFDKDAYDYFESYKHLTASDAEDGEIVVGAMDIIVESLQKQDKSNSKFNITISTGDFTTSGIVELNISDLQNIKVLAELGDIYVEYTDSIYISAGGANVKANLDELSPIIAKITEALPSDGSSGIELDVDQIMADLNSSTMVETDNHVTIDGKLNLLGIDLPLHFEINKVGESYELESANVNLSINGTNLAISLAATSSSVSVKDHSKFQNAKNLEFIVDYVADVLTKKNTDINVKTTIEGLNVEATGNIDFSNGLDADLTAILSNGTDSLDAHIRYVNDTIYLDVDNIKVKITTEDLMKIIGEFTDTNVSLSLDTSSLDLAGILKTVFSLDFDELIKKLVIEENNLELELGLKAISEKLDTLKLSAKKSSTGIDANISILGYSVDVKAGSLGYSRPSMNAAEYQNLGYLTGLLDGVLAIVDAKKLEFTLNGTYSDVVITGNGVVDFTKDVNALVNLSAEYNSNKLDLGVVYINDTIYLDLDGIRLMVTKDDLMDIIGIFTDTESTSLKLDVNSIIGTVLSLDIDKLISKLVIVEDGIDIEGDLSSLSSKLGAIKLGVHENNGTINASASILGIAANIKINKTTKVVTAPTEEYQNLKYLKGILDGAMAIVNSKMFEVTIDLDYDGITAVGNAIVDLTDTDNIKAYAKLDLTLKGNAINVEVYFEDNIAYLTLGNIDLMISVDDLKDIISKFSGDTSGISLDINSILDTVFSLDIDKLIKDFKIVEDELGLNLDLSDYVESLNDIKVVIKKLEEINVNVDAEELKAGLVLKETANNVPAVVDEAKYSDLGNLKDVIDVIKSIIDAKGTEIEIGLVYEDLKVNGTALLSFENELMVKALLSVDYKGLAVDVTVYYDNATKMLYLDLFDNHVSLSIDELTNNLSKSDEDSDLLDTILSIDFVKLLAAITAEDGLNVTLDLSDIEELKDILDLTKNSVITVKASDNTLVLATENLLGLSGVVSPSNKNIVIPDIEYTSLDGLVSDILELVDWIGNESIYVSLDGNVNIKDIEISLEGGIYVLLNEDKEYSVDGALSLSVAGTDHNITVKYVDKMVYLTYGGANIGLDVSDISGFLEEVMEILELDLPDFDFESLNPVLKTITIGDKTLGLNLSDLTELITTLTIALDYANDEFAVGVSGAEVNLTAKATKTTYHEFTLPKSYVTNDDIISLCHTIKNVIDLKDRREFNLALNISTYDNGLKHLDITGKVGVKIDCEEWSDFEVEDLSLTADIAIKEYNEDSTVKVTHRVNLNWIDGYVYIVYGNNESNKSSKIKLYCKIDSLMSIVSSLTQVLGIDSKSLEDYKASDEKDNSIADILLKVEDLLGIDLSFLDEFKNEKLDYVDFSKLTDLVKTLMTKDEDETKTNLNISNKLNKLRVTENGLVVELKANILNEEIPSDKNMIVSISSTEEKPLSLSLTGLYTSYKANEESDDEYSLLEVNSLYLNNDSVVVTKPTSLSGYYDLSDLNKLVDGLLTSASSRDFEISGTATVKLISIISLDIDINARVRVLEDGTPLIYVKMHIPSFNALVVNLTEKDTEIYYRDGYVYINRKDKNGATYNLKVTYEEFFDDIMYYLLDFGMGMPDLVMSQINTETDNSDYVVDAGKVIKSYSSTDTKFTLNLDLGALTGNSSLKDLGLSLNLSEIGALKDEDGTVHTSNALTSISDFKFVVVSEGVVNIKASSLSLKNFDTHDGYKWFKDINMDDVEDFITNYNEVKKYEVDTIYKNGTIQGKRSHSVTFSMTYGENPTSIYKGETGSAIVFPELSIVKDSKGREYQFLGWYSDKACTVPFEETAISDKNIVVYAKWKKLFSEVIVHSPNGDTYIGVNPGDDIMSMLDNPSYVINENGEILQFAGYSLTENGPIISNYIMPDSDLDVYTIWNNTGYSINYNGKLGYELDEKNMLKANDIYLVFADKTLTAEILLENYTAYAVDNVFYIESYKNKTDYYNVEFEVSANFTDKPYISVSLPKTMAFDASLLPNKEYNGMSVNYWYTDNNEYHVGNINTLERVNTVLKAYYASTGYLSFELENGGAIVSGYSYSGEEAIVVVIPKYVLIDGEYRIVKSLKISSKKSVFTGKQNISCIVFNEGFTTIGQNAFQNCINLHSVYLSSTITSIHSEAFFIDYYTSFTNGFENNAAVCMQMRFYCQENGSVTQSTLQSLIACKWNTIKKYYAKENAKDNDNFTAAYQVNEYIINDTVHNMF